MLYSSEQSTLITLSRFDIGTMDDIISEILRKSKAELRKQKTDGSGFIQQKFD